MSNDDTQPATAYPGNEQYDRWKERADELDMSVSEFITSMVEAGMRVDRGFDMMIEQDETNRKLRKQRNELRDELDRARTRIERLEDRLYFGERETILRFIRENPGASFEEIVQHVIDSVPKRVTEHLEQLEGEDLRVEGGEYYIVEDDT